MPRLPSSFLRKRVLGGVLVALVGASVGVYFLVLAPRESDAKAATTVTTAATDLPKRIERSLTTLSPAQLDQPCVDGAGARVPLILSAAADPKEALLLSSASPMNDLSTKVAASGARRIAVVRSLSLAEPHASVGMPSPGRYEAQLVVIDTLTGDALCHSKILAWSSSIVEQPGLGERALRDDFSDRVRAAFNEAGSRLHVDLEL